MALASITVSDYVGCNNAKMYGVLLKVSWHPVHYTRLPQKLMASVGDIGHATDPTYTFLVGLAQWIWGRTVRCTTMVLSNATSVYPPIHSSECTYVHTVCRRLEGSIYH